MAEKRPGPGSAAALGRDIPDLLQLIANVSRCARRDVDLVNLRRVGDVLRGEILDKRRTIHVSEPDKVLDWEASAMTRYARHREEIRNLLEDFHHTGTGYGS